jgi:SAM-dependent methyltransferase
MKKSPHYLDTTIDVYKKAALQPEIGLCCTTTPIWQLPGLKIPKIMQEMNYGCGSTVHPRDLSHQPKVLYVGIGGGMELLQFAYFNRTDGGVIGVDVVDEMLLACQNNLVEAEKENPWFRKEFIDIRKGTALNLPVESQTIDVAAQNCLFNIFTDDDLRTALSEMYRVLRPHGRLVLSDPICETPMPQALKEDATLRALCLSGAISLSAYVDLLTSIGFGTIEIRARRPYRVLSPHQYATDHLLLIESVEVCAIKDPIPADGPCVFTGKTAIYFGSNSHFDDNNGHVLMHNQPLAICDKTASHLENLGRNDIIVTPSTFFYDGGGCC